MLNDCDATWVLDVRNGDANAIEALVMERGGDWEYGREKGVLKAKGYYGRADITDQDFASE